MPDKGLGLSTVYDVHGNPHRSTVEIPLPPGSTSAFAAPAENIFATEDGTITAWSPNVDLHQ